VRIEVCLKSVFLVYGKRSSVLGSSFPPGYFPSRRRNGNKTKNCSRHWTYHPVSRLSIDSYMREQQSRSILHSNETNLNPSPFHLRHYLNAIILFLKKIELGGRTFVSFTHFFFLLSPFGKTILITLRFFWSSSTSPEQPVFFFFFCFWFHISESNPQPWNEGFLLKKMGRHILFFRKPVFLFFSLVSSCVFLIIKKTSKAVVKVNCNAHLVK